MPRLALFGGTFDPPHLGHLALAKTVWESLELDELWFIPAGDPPHKSQRSVTASHHRVAMLKHMLSGTPFTLSTLEVEKSTPSWTVDTLKILKTPERILYLLMGADSLLTLNTWKDYTLFPELCELALIARPGFALKNTSDLQEHLEKHLPEFIGKVHFLQSNNHPISSTEIRKALRAQEETRSLLDPEVAKYIQKHALYQ